MACVGCPGRACLASEGHVTNRPQGQRQSASGSPANYVLAQERGAKELTPFLAQDLCACVCFGGGGRGVYVHVHG